MSTSIYNVPEWSSSEEWLKHDIVSSNGKYYYALSDVPIGGALSVYFGGCVSEGANTRPIFIWRPSYGGQKSINPKINSVQFGDGYEQRSQDGINNILLKMDYTFSERNLAEATAILHFLDQRKGIEWFYFTPERPFNRTKKFICKEWTELPVFYNNHSIRATFQEVAG